MSPDWERHEDTFIRGATEPDSARVHWLPMRNPSEAARVLAADSVPVPAVDSDPRVQPASESTSAAERMYLLCMQGECVLTRKFHAPSRHPINRQQLCTSKSLRLQLKRPMLRLLRAEGHVSPRTFPAACLRMHAIAGPPHVPALQPGRHRRRRRRPV